MTPTETKCPAHLAASIMDYVDFGKPTGGFLRSVLENDLLGAVCRADEINVELIPHVVMFVVNHVPVAAQGSAAKCEAWIARCRQLRATAVSSAPVEMKLEED